MALLPSGRGPAGRAIASTFTALASLAAGCGGTEQAEQVYPVTLRVAHGAVEILERSTRPVGLVVPLHAEHMLRYELRTEPGEILAAGAVPDPRAPRAEWSDADDGALRGRHAAAGAAAVVIHLPARAGDLVLFEDGPEGSRELGRAGFDPDRAPTGPDAAPAPAPAPVALGAGQASDETIDLLFLPEGYTAAELGAFERDVDEMIAALASRPDLGAVWDRFRILRQDVPSAEAGLDDPDAGIERDTAFDVGHGAGADRRCLWPRSADGHARAQRLRLEAGADLAILVVNSDEPGGCAAGLVALSRAGGGDVLPHEIGHALFGLADEYDRGRDELACTRPPQRPAPNLSASPEPGRLPWAELVTAGAFPTPPGEQGAIGAFAGGDRCAAGRYRPEHTCLMRQLDAPLCAVCQSALHGVVRAVADGQPPAPAPLTCAMVSRRAGAGRFETAAAIARSLFPAGAEVAVLASGADVSPDALVAGPLAHRLGGPLLLTERDALPQATAAELSRLGASRVVVIGGTASVGDPVIAALEGTGLTVERIAGGSRFDTAARVAVMTGAADRMAYVVSGEDRSLVDALAAAGPAAALGAPILFVGDRGVPPETAAALSSLGIERTVVVGGAAAVPEEVAAGLPAPARVAGADRFGTAVAVAADARSRGVSAREVFLARADLFPDALAAGAAGQIVLLAAPGVLPEDTRRFLADHVDRAVLLGGTAALGEVVETDTCVALCGGTGCLEGCGDGVCDADETDESCGADCGCSAASCDAVAPFGCYCDPDCAETGDCCADAVEACAPPYPERDAAAIKSLQPDFWPDRAEIAASGAGGVSVNLFWPHWQPQLRAPPCAEDGTEEPYDGACFVVSAALDEIIRDYTARGLVVSAALYGAPEWARMQRDCAAGSGVFCAPDDPADFGRFAGMVARRYDGRRGHGRVADFVIHNEVNAHAWFDVGCGDGRPCDPDLWIDTYTRNFQAAYDQIVRHQPHARVLIPLEHHFGQELDAPAAAAPLLSGETFLTGFGARVGPRAWRVAFHPYPPNLLQPGFSADDHPKITYGNVGAIVGWLRQRFPDRPSAWQVQLTESGVNSIAPHSSEAAQADGVCRSLRNTLASPGIDSYVYHRMLDHEDELANGLGTGLRRADGSAKPAWSVWAGASAPGSLACGFEELPYVRLTRWSSPARGSWTSSRLPPDGFTEVTSVRLLRAPAPGTRLLYECALAGHNLITADPGCEGQRPLGPVGFVHTSPVAGTVPLHRCTRDAGRDHFVSLDPGCEGATPDGLLGHALP